VERQARQLNLLSITGKQRSDIRSVINQVSTMSDETSQFVPRRKKMILRELNDECLLYDEITNHAHCLNQFAAEVWKLCDGTNNIAEITLALGEKLNSRVEEHLIWMAVRRFQKCGLLLNAIPELSGTYALSRRELARKLGRSAVIAFPLVTSIVVPTPAIAASCFPLLHLCTSNSQCCSNHCGLQGASLVCLP